MKKLHISDDLALPPDAVTRTFVVYGGKGKGKTNFGSVLCEELSKAHLRFCVTDPLDVWWGLQHGRTKEESGIDVVILGGAHGDIPIEPAAGAVIADFVADEDVNTVVVMRRADGTMWSNGERIRFMRDFTRRLFQRQGEQRRPLMLVIDEAGRFVPQQMAKGSPDIAECVGAIEELVEWGRNVGIGVTLITQRSARMAKNVSELAECMVAFQTAGPNSVAAIVEWFGEHVPKERQHELVAALRKLPVGRALIVSPEWLDFEREAQIRLRETFDSSATPKAGGSLRAPGQARKPDLEKYQARMAETIERAKEADPREWKKREAELKKKIAELERQAAKPVPAAKEKAIDPEKLRTTAQKMADRALAKALRPYFIAGRRFVETLAKGAAQLVAGKEELVALLAQAEEIEKAGAPIEVEPERQSGGYLFPGGTPKKVIAEVARNVQRAPRTTTPPSDGMLSKMGRAILTAFAQHPEGLTKGQALVFADYRSSGPVSMFFGAANANGWLESNGAGRLCITEPGLAVLGDFDPLPTGTALREYVLDSPKLSTMEKAIMRVAFEVYPNAIGKGALLEKANYKSSGPVSTAFGKFNAMGWLTQPQTGHVRASDTFFEEQ